MRNASACARPAGFFVLRTPLLPFDELVRWGEALSGVTALAEPERLGDALAADRALLRARLAALVDRPEVREALFIASPGLEAHLARWREAADSRSGLQVERALVRYVQRMAARATPFGLFSGSSSGRLGADTRLSLAGHADYQRRTRLDMGLLVVLSESLAREPAQRERLTWRPNSSIYRAAGQLRFSEVLPSTSGQEGRAYRATSLTPSEYLELTLEKARHGVRRGALAEALAAHDPDIDLEDAEQFIDKLIDSQVLVPDLEPPVTGIDPALALVQALRGGPPLESGTDAAAVLEETRVALEALDREGLGVPPVRYHAATRPLEALPVPTGGQPVFQVDLMKPVREARLGPGVLEEALAAVELLHRISPRQDDALRRFRTAFRERYERREVPLLEVLDAESGIGFPDDGEAPALEAAPLLSGLELDGEEESPTTPWEERHTFLQRKLHDVLRSGASELVLEPEDLQVLEQKGRLPLPAAFSMVATLAAASEAAVDGGEFRLCVHSVNGPSGANVLARFCHADAGLADHVRALLRAEEAHHPEALHAELAHLPEGHVGNVLLRPLLREHEIPFLGRSGAPEEQRIPLSELLVSVVGERVVLRSARLGREVLPRLTTTHNVKRGLPVYRFLGALQGQGVAANLRWRWGPLEGAPYLPRVVSGRLVLSLARWWLPEQTLRMLGSTSGEPLFRAVQALRQQLRLPRYVALEENDQRLPVDLDNLLSIEAFAQRARGLSQARLVELFPGPDALPVQGPEGRFVHELVIPFVRTPEPARTAREVPVSARVPAPSLPRLFPPGSEWLYVKLSCGPVTADRVLRTVVAPLVEDVLGSGAADGWFFIRYRDPEWHLRLRFHGEPRRLLGEVLPALHEATAPLLADGRLWRVQLDTYQREVERYGGETGILLAEQLFQLDSEAVLALLSSLGGAVSSPWRWRLALRAIDALWESLGLDMAARGELARKLREGLWRQLRPKAALEHQLGARYRQERTELERLFTPGPLERHPLTPAMDILRHRSERMAPIAAALREAETSGRLGVRLPELAAAFAHMQTNRLLRAAGAREELVFYDFLSRLYASQLARGARRETPDE
ncbi:lantibiotic dehydratase [Archangium lipolyticum]|uniref:lantibiotic dehydratase n=1 Tax=Archangium lipolyticum TaxID=2970465 RepID=UPI002149E4C3|nr:lantibiotic dehydratase [Archangium lipolyticum]